MYCHAGALAQDLSHARDSMARTASKFAPRFVLLLQMWHACAQGAAPTTVVQPGSGTLQAALNVANAGDILVLQDGRYKGSGDNVLAVSKNITIRAQNLGMAILDGEDTRRVIQIMSGSVVLKGLVITRGRTGNGRGGGLRINGGIVDMIDCEMHTNTASNRGGAMRITGGIVTLVRCLIHSNTVSKRTGPRGGGVFINSGAIVHFHSCIIRNNRALSTGGGVFISGAITYVDFNNCSIHDNTVLGGEKGYTGDGLGGGVSITGGRVHFSTTSIYNNRAASNTGGGLAIGAGNVTLASCQVHHNEAAKGGGAVIISRGMLSILQSQVHHNKAKNAGALMISSPEGETVVDGKKYGRTRVELHSSTFDSNESEDATEIEVIAPALACSAQMASNPSSKGAFVPCVALLPHQ